MLYYLIIHKAIQHINSIEAGEGTNIHQPLKEGINMIKDDILNYYYKLIMRE